MENTTIILIGLLLVIIIILLLRQSTQNTVTPKKVTIIRPSYWLGPGGTKRWYPPRRHSKPWLGPGGTYHPLY